MKKEFDLASFETQDVGLASALVANGYDLVRASSEGFMFWEDEEGFNALVSSYRSGSCEVKAHEFYRIVRLLNLLAGIAPTYDF